MSKRMTRKGQVTIPKKMREALELTVGDGVEFGLNAAGEVVVRKSAPPPRPARPAHRHGDTQLNRRAAELRSLLRGLD
jgi:antitoxin PrlF